MRIAFFHELPFGGARQVVSEYALRLSRRHTVDLYYVAEREDFELTPLFRDVFFYQYRSKEWHGKNWRVRLYKDTAELYKLALLHRKIAAEIDRGRYDFVFVHPSRFTQAPFVLRYLTTKSFYFCEEPLRIVYDEFLRGTSSMPFLHAFYEKVNRGVRKWIDKTNFDRAFVVLANSKFSKRWIKTAYGRDADLCYLGVDTLKFRPMEVKKIHDILFLGQKEKIEGYDLFEASLPLFDKRPVVAIIERDENGIGISEEELVYEYNKAKVVVALARNEPFGLIPLEAMACGIPVVAVEEGGFKESIVHNKTGFFIQRDPKELRSIVEKLLQDTNLRKRIGEQARKYVKQYWQWEKSVSRFLEITQKYI